MKNSFNVNKTFIEILIDLKVPGVIISWLYNNPIRDFYKKKYYNMRLNNSVFHDFYQSYAIFKDNGSTDYMAEIYNTSKRSEITEKILELSNLIYEDLYINHHDINADRHSYNFINMVNTLILETIRNVKK